MTGFRTGFVIPSVMRYAVANVPAAADGDVVAERTTLGGAAVTATSSGAAVFGANLDKMAQTTKARFKDAVSHYGRPCPGHFGAPAPCDGAELREVLVSMFAETGTEFPAGWMAANSAKFATRDSAVLALRDAAEHLPLDVRFYLYSATQPMVAAE